MAEHAPPARKPAEPQASAKAPAAAAPGSYGELLNRRSEAALAGYAEVLAHRAAANPLTAPLRPPGPQLVQPTANRTGIPDRLKAGVEALSGVSMDDVRVYRNSSRPAQLQAHAYAEGTDIHLAPGQEQHLAHESWHVVQQKQGRVGTTARLNGRPINDDPTLEREADRLGSVALRSDGKASAVTSVQTGAGPSGSPLQGVFAMVGGRDVRYDESRFVTAMDGMKRLASILSDPPVRAAVLAKIKEWATCDEDVGFKGNTYEKVIERALQEVRDSGSTSSQSHAVPSSMPDGGEQALHAQEQLSLSDPVKKEQLKTLRRQASLDADELSRFRDVRSKAELTHRDDPDVRYGIASTSNFMLGGSLGDSYAEIIHQAQLETGRAGPALARILLDGLRGEEIASPHKGAVAKFVSLIHGPEFRRAAINPLAVDVALQRIIREGDSDVFAALSRNVLLFAGEPREGRGKGLGGSKRSQFHREAVSETPEFLSTAANEYDSFVKAAANAGYDVRDERQMKTFIGEMARDHVLAHKVIFLGHERPPKAAETMATNAGTWTSGQIAAAVAVAAIVLGLIATLLKG